MRGPRTWVAWGAGCVVVLGAMVVLLWGLAHLLRQRDGAAPRSDDSPLEVAPVPVPGGVARLVSPPGILLLEGPRWSAEGRWLFFTASPAIRPASLLRLPFQLNVFDPKTADQATTREMIRLLMPSLYRVDTLTGACQRVSLPLPGETGLTLWNGLAVAPDGRRLVFQATDYAQVTSWDDAGAAPELWVAQVAPDGTGAGLRRLGAIGACVWAPDSRRLLYNGTGQTPETFIVETAQGKPRRLCGKRLASAVRAWSLDGRTAYGRVATEKPGALGLKSEVFHLDTATGQTRRLPLRGGRTRLGALGPYEQVVRHYHGTEAHRLLDLGAVDLRTGRLRWLQRNLKGLTSSARQPLLGGRVLWFQDGATAETREEFYYSLQEGRFRRVAAPRFGGQLGTLSLASPDGQQVVYEVHPRNLVSLNPFSKMRVELWLAHFTRPEELLPSPAHP